MINAETGALDTHEEAGAKGGRDHKADSNTTGFNEGRGSTYALKRLKRDRPASGGFLPRALGVFGHSPSDAGAFGRI